MHLPLGNDRTTKYEILVRGTIAADFVQDIGAQCRGPSDGKTVVVIDALDQSHLRGILEHLGDHTIEIESVNSVSNDDHQSGVPIEGARD